jgi:pyruvate,orthophosphate dikinase
VASGEIVTTPAAAVAAAAAGRAVILVRHETSPDDVHGMAAAAGILTATGGLASHAAVVARGWGIPAVVGAAELVVEPTGVRIGGRFLEVGATISIDGGTGEIFAGTVTGGTEVAPEAAKLRAWAGELGIPIGDDTGRRRAAGRYRRRPPTSRRSRRRAIIAAVKRSGGLRRARRRTFLAPWFRGTPPGNGGRARFARDAAQARPPAADGFAEIAAGLFRRSRRPGDGHGADARATAAWGTDQAVHALDAFLALDHRMKATVTAWQLRDVDGAQTLNDHTDAAHDARVLADLAALHADADAWLVPEADGVPRLAAYRERLDRANAAAQAGDGRFVASPRVDSYHTIWFELHEDLILSRASAPTRSPAGRA